MKKQICLLFYLLLTSCAKNQNIFLAKNYYEQSLIESGEQNYKKALMLVNKSIESCSTPQALALKATLLYQINSYSESLLVFKQVIDDKKTPRSLRADIMNNYACTLLNLDKKNEAKKVWLELTKEKEYLSPEVAWFNLGMMELMEAKFKDKNERSTNLELAKKDFQNAVSTCQEYIDAYFFLAITLTYLEDINEAKKTLIELLSNKPEHVAARQLLEELY